MHGSLVFTVSTDLFALLATAEVIVADLHLTIGTRVRRGREEVKARSDRPQRVRGTQRDGRLL